MIVLSLPAKRKKHMKELNGFNPKNLTKEEISILEEKMVKCYKILSRCSCEQYQGEVNIKRLRQDYNSGKLTLIYDTAARKAFQSLQQIEGEVISAYIKISAKFMKFLSGFRKNCPGITNDDYIQEAALAIYDAIYTYDGGNNFSTYVYSCIHNRLINFCKREQNNAKATKRKDVDFSLLFSSNESICHIDKEEVQLAIKMANLTSLQKELIDSFLKGERRKTIYKNIINNTVNPKTGKPYSLQRMSLVFRQACDKIKESYLLIRKAA